MLSSFLLRLLLLLEDDLHGISSSTLREDLRQELFLDDEDEEGPA